ncbi:hypothetical protein AA0113_g12500 [Alternaria arborescens]|uniref:Uncharacterized protein n=3 Tax=Alternaria sect. Alternaria TaxID=2499237 RepID=A0A4Q4MXZ8_ALTAL|nr:hypothetical protein AA0117_g12928 [Alternaria alternata]RYN85750.1 hypothetical protein AA0119_g13159 [Alternaria tenuissima]RYO02874.1 hypothetical protein AA0121_g13202 [Alternaria tenuissima]RYO26409.1 hypothetical protein AA0113_g12500 [Alternaria arborescens]RYO48186.1 hypothetical protein AA0116_g12766 [Alternaria tenuissima]
MHPLPEFQSLRDFGRVMGRTDPPSFLFRWSDDGQTISHGTKHVSMDDFRRFTETFTSEAEHICQELMFGVLPPVDLGQVKDEISNTSQGFSFVHHAGNDLSEAYMQLSTRACTTRRNGLLREGRWNWKAVFLYSKKVEALLEAVAGMCYLSGGQLPRVSELFGLECENGPASARGLYVYSGCVVYLIRHHKAKRSTNREFYVARYLPARASRVVYYYLVYIRPFVKMLRRERRDTAPSPDSTLPFCSDHTPDPPWESRKLTAILQRANSQVWGWPVNAQLCRQLSIAITEKHVKAVHQRFNRYDDKTSNADITVALAWQSGHRPLQRANTYGLDGAFPTHLQPSLLRAYEWVSIRWHEFLQQPTKGSISDISTGEGGSQQQSPSVAHQQSPAQASLGDRMTPKLLPTYSEASSIRKRKRCAGDNATRPLKGTFPDAGKRQKYSAEKSHSPKVTPYPPAVRLSDDDSSPANNDLPATSFVQSLTCPPQRKHSCAATPPPDREKDVQDLLCAPAEREVIACDNKRQRFMLQAKEPESGNGGRSTDATRLSVPNQATDRDGKRGLLHLLAGSARRWEERISDPIDLETLRSQVKIWSGRCSLCYIRGYWCSRQHTIAHYQVPGADQVGQTRNVLQRNMISFRDGGGSFCTGQCEMSINLFLPASDPKLRPECACEFAVLDGLSAMMGDPGHDRLNNHITELRKQESGSQDKDLHTWLCSTEEVVGDESATATRVFGQLSRVARRMGTPEPVDRSVSTRLVRDHLAQRDKADKQLWAEGKHPILFPELLLGS